MSDAMHEALLFLIDSIFNVYLFILVVRLLLVWIKADYFNPITQFTVKLTDFLIKPLRKIIPTVKQIEFPTLLVIFVLEIIKFTLLLLISYEMPHLIGLPVLAFGDIGYLIIQTFLYAIVLQVLLSFIQPASPLIYTLHRLTDPILRPIQRVLPVMGGLDLSPIPALIILQLLKILLIGPIMALGQSLALG